MPLLNRLALIVVATFIAVAPEWIRPTQPPVLAAAVTRVPPPVAAHTYVYIFDGVTRSGLPGCSGWQSNYGEPGSFIPEPAGGTAGTDSRREIRAASAADPSARFALIGFSAGSYKARALANRLIHSGVPVAVVGYIGGDYLRDKSDTRVPAPGLVVNITGDGYLLTGAQLTVSRDRSFRGVECAAERDVALRPAHTSANVLRLVRRPGGGRQLIRSSGKRRRKWARKLRASNRPFAKFEWVAERSAAATAVAAAAAVLV